MMQCRMAGQGTRVLLSAAILTASLACTSSTANKCASGTEVEIDGSCHHELSLQDRSSTGGNALLQMKTSSSKRMSSESARRRRRRRRSKKDNNDDNKDSGDNNWNFGGNGGEDGRDPSHPGGPTKPPIHLKGLKSVMAQVIKEEVDKIKAKVAAVTNDKTGIIKVGRIVEKNRKYLDRLFDDVHMYSASDADDDNENNDENNNEDNDENNNEDNDENDDENDDEDDNENDDENDDENDNENDDKNDDENNDKEDNDSGEGNNEDGATPPPATQPPEATQDPPKGPMECWAFCYFALKCSGECSGLGDMGRPPNCAVNGQSQCQGQFPGGGTFTSNGDQCQCQCGGKNIDAQDGDFHPGIKILWMKQEKGCQGNPMAINGKQHGNLGQFDVKDPNSHMKCKQACMDSPACVFGEYQYQSGACSAYGSCGERSQQGQLTDVFQKTCKA